MNFSPSDIRLIAFYLPQFHPIPENNEWWGEGFTEWTNVRKTVPRFRDHYQPHVPSQLGCYDLRDAEIKERQAVLAKEYGIYGFCYYHYWFNGKRLLETPFEQVLATGKPDFPFCLCWANENWTRRWDGSDHEILIAQNYSHEDDRRFISSLLPAFRDERYIRVNGKPLFVVYSSERMPDPKKTTEIWRSEMLQMGIGDLYLVRVEKNVVASEPNPLDIGFDAAIEFAPNWGSLGSVINEPDFQTLDHEDPTHSVYSYEECMFEMLGREKPDYKLFRGAFPSWDNSARRESGATIFAGASPEKYAFWLSHIAQYTLEIFRGDEQLIFVNAWNEWAEGCHLEPDKRNGLKYLEASRNALGLARRFHEIKSSLRTGKISENFSFDNWYNALDCFSSKKLAYDLDILQVYNNFIEYQMIPSITNKINVSVNNRVKEKEHQISEMQNTLSWRLTKPLRMLGRMFLSHPPK